MSVLMFCTLVSSFSFLAYVFAYFKKPHMKNEFKRFGLKKFSLTTIVLQLLGALGLLVGLRFYVFLLIASFGLALLMFLGLLVRLRVKDSFLVSFPSFFYFVLNSFIFCLTISTHCSFKP